MPPNAGPTDPIVIDETLIPATIPHWFPNWPHPVPLPTPAQASAAVSGHQGKTAHIAHFPALQLVVKFGRAARVPISEGQALWVLRRYAVDVPVPDVYGWCVDGGETFVYMQRVEGDTLTSCWAALDPEQKADVVAQLAEIISTMRRLTPKGSPYVGSLCRLPIKDQLWLNQPAPAPGPLQTTAEFNDAFWRLAARLPGFPSHPYFVDIRKALSDDAPIHFTHPDLGPDNILVSHDDDATRLRITAIVDWSECGWFPNYWASIGADHPVMYHSPDWGERLSGWLGDHQAEREAYHAYEATGIF